MAHPYMEYTFRVDPIVPWSEILTAQLGALGFESFEETEIGINAYIRESYDKDIDIDGLAILSNSFCNISYTKKRIEPVNWNSEWEKNFEPITIGDQCLVRAPFHAPGEVAYEIIIEPKMSFGTGHHETTHMMLEFILEKDFSGLQVLDMGCGTAVLAILANMRGAKEILAIDNDPWCVENAIENATRNQVNAMKVELGNAGSIQGSTFNVILANINRNILLNDLGRYLDTLLPGGEMYLSGFYESDLPIIIDHCNKLGATFVEKKVRQKWIAAKFVN